MSTAFVWWNSAAGAQGLYECDKQKRKQQRRYIKSHFFFLSLSVNIPINKLELALKYCMNWLLCAQRVMSFALGCSSHPLSLLALTFVLVAHMKLEII